ncbi:glycoside hydrolase family 78 protein [Xylariomycetidae sp. FL0641]|nr:glycoside hydrolase family 78 protein [Xylariomycetidae sp. FL0641]
MSTYPSTSGTMLAGHLVTFLGLILLGLDTATCAEPNWQQYVRGPSNSVVQPHAILGNYTQGDVSNPEGLLGANVNGTATVLRRGLGQGNTSLVLDFGQNVVGQLVVDFAGSVNGSEAVGFPGLKLVFSETLQYLGDRSDFTRSDNAGQSPGDPPKVCPSGTDQIAVKNQPYTWINEWGCEYAHSRVCSDGLHGFRYLRLQLDALPSDAPYTSPAGEVRIRSVRLRWSAYRGTPDTYTGWFACSDAALSQYWFDGAYTAELGLTTFRANDSEPRGAASPTLEGKSVLLDGAKRDRDPYVGDLAVAALTGYLAHAGAAREAAKHVLADIAAHQRGDGWLPPASIRNYSLPLFDYPLWWVVCLHDLILHTGDDDDGFLAAQYGTLQRVLDAYYPAHTDPETGLLARPDGYGDYAFLPRGGAVAYDCALYVLALRRGAALASLLPGTKTSDDAAADAHRWRAAADAVAAAVRARLWDPAAGAFRDCSGGAGCATAAAHPQDANSLAILAGIADAAQAAGALAYLSRNTARRYGNAFYDAAGGGAGFAARVYPFLSYFEIAARFETSGAEDATGALEQLRRTWAWTAAGHDPGVTAWEAIGEAGRPYAGAFTSAAHGWSSGVAPLLTRYVLGVAPAAPGFAGWEVRPRRAAGLGWAQGEVATAYGPLAVRWDVGRGGGLRVRVAAPAGTRGFDVTGGREVVVVYPDVGDDREI